MSFFLKICWAGLLRIKTLFHTVFNCKKGEEIADELKEVNKGYIVYEQVLPGSKKTCLIEPGATFWKV